MAYLIIKINEQVARVVGFETVRGKLKDGQDFAWTVLGTNSYEKLLFWRLRLRLEQDSLSGLSQRQASHNCRQATCAHSRRCSEGSFCEQGGVLASWGRNRMSCHRTANVEVGLGS
jgi:hypothetical protein